MSNPIGAGTAQITYNGPAEESQLLSRLAFEMETSRGELLRDLILRGLQSLNAAAANQVQHIRKERLRMKHGIVCLLLFGISMQFIYAPMAVLRRPSRRGRRDETSEVVIVIHGSDHGAELRGRDEIQLSQWEEA